MVDFRLCIGVNGAAIGVINHLRQDLLFALNGVLTMPNPRPWMPSRKAVWEATKKIWIVSVDLPLGDLSHEQIDKRVRRALRAAAKVDGR